MALLFHGKETNMAKSYSEFKSMYLGKSVDVDGYPVNNIYQCWDLVSGLYFPYIGGKKIHCGGSGYVIEIALNKDTNGLLAFTVDVGLKETLQQGDICIWGRCPACPKSHIAIYDHDEGQSKVYFLGQNQPYNKVTVKQIDVSGIIGVFRPKIFINQKPTPVPKKCDQLLTVGSKVQSYGFYVQKLRVKNGQWQMYNDWVGGWIPTAHVHEVDARDGRKDNILHIGSGVAFDGTLTVSAINVKRNMAYLKELGYWVYSRCLNEVKEGR